VVTGDPTNETHRASFTLSLLEEEQSLGAWGRKLLRSRHAISVQNKQLPTSKQMMWAAADLQNSSFGYLKDDIAVLKCGVPG
jgi:hypothetical protein